MHALHEYCRLIAAAAAAIGVICDAAAAATDDDDAVGRPNPPGSPIAPAIRSGRIWYIEFVW